jgi:hypothetical protein
MKGWMGLANFLPRLRRGRVARVPCRWRGFVRPHVPLLVGMERMAAVMAAIRTEPIVRLRHQPDVETPAERAIQHVPDLD